MYLCRPFLQALYKLRSPRNSVKASFCNADIMGVGKGQGTSSSTEEKRIIKPEEFAYLQDVVCVFPNGYKRLQKANYYEDSTFTSKM